MGFLETNKKNEDLKEPICSVGVQNILQMLHLHSEEEAYKASKNFKIFNSAIEQRGHELQFAGAGKHVLVFTPLADNWKPNDLVKVAETYIHNFTGEKIKLSYLLFIPIQREMSQEEWRKYLSEHLSESSSSEAFSFNIDLLCPTSEVKTDLMRMLFEATPNKNVPFKSKMKDFDIDLAGKNRERISGYFLRFNVVTGEFERKSNSTPILTAWNNVLKTARQTLDGISISKFDWKSGSEGLKHYLGNFINSILGKIDAEKLRSSVNEQLQLKHRGMMAHIDIMSSSELVNFLRKRLTRDDVDKISKAEYTLGIKINKAEKGYEQVNVPYIADIINKSIEKSLINKMTGVNNITDDDVILINHYDDNLKDIYYNKYSKTYHLYTGAELNDGHTEAYKHLRSLLTKVLMFKYYKNRIDVFSKSGYSINGIYDFTEPMNVSRIRSAPYNISLSGISSLVDSVLYDDLGIIETLIIRNPLDLSAVLKKWTYLPGTLLYMTLGSLSAATSANINALSNNIAPAFSISPRSIVGVRSNNIAPIAALLSNDTFNSSVSADVCKLIDLMKTDSKVLDDVKYNREKAKSHRTEYDVYLVPLENLVVKTASPKTRPDLELK